MKYTTVIKENSLLHIFIIIFFGFIIYSNSFNGAFQFDDFGDIVNNADIHSLSSIKPLWDSPSKRPLAMLTFALNYHFHQYEVWGYHAVNVIIHVLTAGLVYWLIMLLLSAPVMRDDPIKNHAYIIAFLAGLLFVIHPIQTQAVTYIVQRMTSLATLFYLLSLILYLKARLETANRIMTCVHFTLAVVTGILGMYTKQIAFTLPASILLVELMFFKTGKWQFKITVKWLIAAGLGCFMLLLGGIVTKDFFMSHIFRDIQPQQGHIYTLTGYSYLCTQFRVIVTYVRLLFVPVHQNVDYDYPVYNSLWVAPVIGSLLLLALVFITGIVLFRKRRLISFGMFWFFLTLSVESSILPLPNVIFEQRLYLPGIGFFIAVISALYYGLWQKFPKAVLVFAVGIISVFSLLTYERNTIWNDEFTLWNDVVKKSPSNVRALTNRAKQYLTRKEYDNALIDLNRALELNPYYLSARNTRACLYSHRQQYHEALDDFAYLLKLNPQHAEALNNRGNVYFQIQNYQQAIADFDAALAIEPDKYEIYLNRGTAYAQLGRSDDAIKDFNSILKINPCFYQVFNNRGKVYLEQGNFEAAVADFNRALGLNPQYVEALRNRGYLFSLIGQFESAIADFTQAINIDSGIADVYNKRALAYFLTNEYEKSRRDVFTVQHMGGSTYPKLLHELEKLSASESQERSHEK